MYFLLLFVLPHHDSTYGGEMELFFSVNLKDNHYSVGNFFHDHGHDYDHHHDHHHHHHVLVLVHNFGMILHSLQGMAQFQLDETGDSSLITHYFVQQQEDMKLVHNIL